MEWAEHHWVAWGPLTTAPGWSTDPAQWLAAFPSPRCGPLLSPTRGAGRSHLRAQLHFQQHPSYGGQAAVPAALAASFCSGLETTGEAEPQSCHPTRSPLHRSNSANPSQKPRAASFSFLSLSVSGSGGWGLARICREATEPCLRAGGWPCASPKHGGEVHGQWGSGAGWDDRGLLRVRAWVGWVQGGESTYRPCWCSQPTPQQVSESPPAAPRPGGPANHLPPECGGLARHQSCPGGWARLSGSARWVQSYQEGPVYS